MNKLSEIQTFIIFCMEAYKNKYKLTGEDVFNLFRKFDVFIFLENGYDVLHTQSMDYMVTEIHELIKRNE